MPYSKKQLDGIAEEAKKRFHRCVEWEAVARKRWLEDVKFANGDADNMYQWPSAVRDARGWGTNTERPCLTVNKTRQHCLQIINDARQNKTSVKIRPAGGRASFDAAQVLEGIVRRVEYISDAQSAYLTATRHQVQGGLGYWRLVTDYASPDTFDQDIFIRRVKDPLSVYLDPDLKEADGSDARFGFVFDDMPRDEFEAQYPKFKDRCGWALGDADDGWVGKDSVRVAEYFRKSHVKDRLVSITKEDGSQVEVRESKIEPLLKPALQMALDDPQTLWREVTENTVEWFLIVGGDIADQKTLPGQYIPIVRVVGEETVIDGELDRKGHVRALKDPQRMYNYNASAQVEFGALQNKIPYIAPAQAIEGYESYWNSANTENYSVLPYNGVTEEGTPIAAPERAQPPGIAPAYQQGMQNAANDMMLVSGQYEAMMGAPGNERSGKAINERQRQGDNATYHFIDHQAMAIRFTGKIIIDWIPHIYDTRRTVKIMAEDGSDSEVMIDPQAAQAYAKQKAALQETAEEVILNPSIGMYDVMADVGPAYATRRQEAFNAFSQIAAQNQELMTVIGDLVFKYADFPGAEEIADRLKRMVPPQALGDGPTPQVQQLLQQNQQLQQMMQKLVQEIAIRDQKLKDQTFDKGLDLYEAETKRTQALQKALPLDAEGLQALVRQTIVEALTPPPAPPQQLPSPAGGPAMATPSGVSPPLAGGAAAPVPMQGQAA